MYRAFTVTPVSAVIVLDAELVPFVNDAQTELSVPEQATSHATYEVVYRRF